MHCKSVLFRCVPARADEFVRAIEPYHQITGYVDRAVGRSFMDIGFRFGNAILPLYRSEPPGQILILPDILSAGNPGAAMTEPSISALLSPTNQSPVRGRITGTVIRRPVQQVPGGPVTNELWFCVAYDFTVRQPLSSNSRQGTTSYGPEQRYYDAVYAVRLPNVSVATVQRCWRAVC